MFTFYRFYILKILKILKKMASGDIYQFKVTLRGSKPPIWRRIQVPANYTFWNLHVAIADAMGWKGMIGTNLTFLELTCP